MDPRLFTYYNRELQYIREMGGEFAKEFPKIAGRLGLDGFECADPYVERLLEGFAFLSARIQLKLGAEFPRFTQHLLEMVYPHYLSPTPSMAVAQFQPDLTEGSLAEGFTIPRGSSLRSLLGRGDQTPCEYRTAHELKLWPIELTEVDYFSSRGAVATLGVPDVYGVKAGIRFRINATAGLTFDQIALDKLPIFMRGSGEIPTRIYEQLLANPVAVVVRPRQTHTSWQELIDRKHIRRLGFEDDEALLPYTERSFQGYRLLQEYFAFPERYMMVEFGGLQKAIRKCTKNEIEIIVMLDRSDPVLENVLDASNFALFCSPIVNLFPKRADRIHINERQSEFHVIADRTRPMDYEIHSIKEVVGYGTSSDSEKRFDAFYAKDNVGSINQNHAYYTMHRVPRMLSSHQRQHGPRSSYIGSELYVSLVDANEAPYSSDLRQLGLDTLCTNRDLPLHMPIGKDKTDFTLDASAPVESIRALAGPTKPKAPSNDGNVTWKLISHLSLNYLTLVDNDTEQGAKALRELLMLYGDKSDASIRKQIDGVRSIVGKPIIHRLPVRGPVTFGRGIEITLTCEESAFEGAGVFLLGSVLEQFFDKYVSINSFTQTVLRTVERDEVMRWPVRIGQRHTI